MDLPYLQPVLAVLQPVFRGVDWELFEGVKASYKEKVLCVVSRVANEHKEEAEAW